MPEITTPLRFDLFPIVDKSVELSFTGEQISSDGGLLLLREVENQIGLIDRISNCITDNRDQRCTDHSLKEMLLQRVFQIAAGYEDGNDCNDLRNDMVFKMYAGRLPQSGSELASQPNMSRFENSVVNKDLYRIGELIFDNFVESYSDEPPLIIVRGDGHFASAVFMDWCEEKYNIGFLTGLTGNIKLHQLANVAIKSAEREFRLYGKPVQRYHSFWYLAGSWAKPRRAIVKVEVSDMGTNIRYIVTNQTQFRTRDLYEKGYCARGAMELRIWDHKLYLKSDRSSCNNFKASQFRLLLHSLAYVLLHTFQQEVLQGTEFANVTIKTIQNKVIKTAAWVKELKTKIKIELPRCCPTKAVQTNCLQMFSILRV